MKILLIDVNCKNSSTGKIVYDLYSQLNAMGHDAAVCYGRGKIVEGKNIFKFGLDWETNIHAGLARITGLNGCFSFFSTLRLMRFIKMFQPDVVHIHELHAYFVNYKPLLRYLKRKKIKTVWTFHCEYMYTGKCGYAYECDHWLNGCGNCPAVKRYPASLFFDFTKKMFRDKKQLLSDWDFTVVTPSRWLAARVGKSFLKNKAIKVIHNGIDCENIFYPRCADGVKALKQKYGLENKRIVLSVAPNIMSERKGGKKVIEISRKFTETDIHFVLIGADSDGKFGANVTILKRTADQHELALWYSAADVFLICSKKENFPTTCIEAFCCGTPVAGIDEGGTGETVPAPFGRFCAYGDASGLAGAVKLQMDLKERCEEIGKLGGSLYDKKIMSRSYLELYQ